MVSFVNVFCKEDGENNGKMWENVQTEGQNTTIWEKPGEKNGTGCDVAHICFVKWNREHFW